MLKTYPPRRNPHVIDNTIKRSVLTKLVRHNSPNIPASVRIGTWSFEWTGKGWTRDYAKPTDVILLEKE